MIKPPQYAALINPIASSAYAMRCIGRADVIKTGSFGSGGFVAGESLIHVDLVTPTLDANEAVMCIAPFVIISNPLCPTYAGQLLAARLSMEIAKEVVIDRELLGRFLVAPPFKGCGDQEVFVGRDESSLLGLSKLSFLCANERISIKIEDIPLGAGPIEYQCGVILARYTTKLSQSLLFGVGELDAQQQANPIHCEWNSGTKSPQLSKQALETAYGDTLREMLMEKEREIRRLKEEATWKDKEASATPHPKITVIHGDTVPRPKKRTQMLGAAVLALCAAVAAAILYFAIR